MQPSSRTSRYPFNWNFTLLFLLLLGSLTLNLILNSTKRKGSIPKDISIPPSSTLELLDKPYPTRPHTPRTTESESNQQQQQQLTLSTHTAAVTQHPKTNHALIIQTQPNMIRNIKFLVSAIGLEILGAIAIKFLLPSAPFTSIVAGLITTRRVRFLAKLKQMLMFLPKIARFEKRFKKLSMALKTIQKGLYSQQKPEENE